eukprot:31135-Pelagococcus_subviridis.AAC.11
MKTTPPSRPPTLFGAAAATARVRQNCVFPAPAGPTSSLIDPVGTPPLSARSNAARCVGRNAGHDAPPPPPPSPLALARAPEDDRAVPPPPPPPPRCLRSAIAVCGLGQTHFATDATTRSAVGSDTSRSSTRSSDDRVRTSSAVLKLCPSRRLRTSTSRPATRARLRLAAMTRASRARATASNETSHRSGALLSFAGPGRRRLDVQYIGQLKGNAIKC